MKNILVVLLLSLCFVSAKAQTAMTPATGTVDSSATEYITATVAGNAGYLTIQPVITKVANTGSTVAGYCLLQGSVDGTNFVNVPTWKYANYNSTPSNLFGTDTFTLTNVTTAQTYVWRVTLKEGATHPYLYYRIAVVMTTTKVTATGTYLYRKQY
jgi:hypothetical protein